MDGFPLYLWSVDGFCLLVSYSLYNSFFAHTADVAFALGLLPSEVYH